MSFMQIIKTKNGYWYGEGEDEFLFPIVQIFLDITDFDFLKKWLLDPEQDYSASNSYYLMRRTGDDPDKISVGFESELIDPEQPGEVKVHRDVLLKLVDSWLNFTSQNADEIILHRDGENVYMTAKFYDKDSGC